MIERFPHVLRAALTAIPATRIRERVSDLFAPIEQAWHLADLEIEGYGARIEQLRERSGAHFLDFHGELIATQRRYIDLDLESALIRFESARASNLERLRNASDEQRKHTAMQEGVDGPVTLARVEQMMSRHDSSHAAEIVQLLRAFGCAIPDELAATAELDDPLLRTA